ncbi:MAG: hypothetical protein ACPIOQ_37260, partial [Promethearchaeia archaeon]
MLFRKLTLTLQPTLSPRNTVFQDGDGGGWQDRGGLTRARYESSTAKAAKPLCSRSNVRLM